MKAPDPALGPELTAWVSWLAALADSAWASRGEAAHALGVRPDELSRILSGKQIRPREWLDDDVFPALHRAGHDTGAEERHQARTRYMAALKSFETLEKDKPGKRRKRRPSWLEYTLRDRMEEAARRLELLDGQLARTRAQEDAAQRELQGLRTRYEAARTELEDVRQAAHTVTLRNTGHEQQLAHASGLVRDLEEQIQAREVQRQTMLERIRHQQHAMRELRTAHTALQDRLAELKARYAWRREAERRLRQQLDFRRQTLALITACTGVATAAWLVDGFTIPGTGAQQIPPVLACVLSVGVLYLVLNVLLLPLCAAVAVPAAAAARRGHHVAALMVITPLITAGAAAPFVLYPYVLWLSVQMCRDWLGLPITLDSGLPAVLAALIVLVTAVLVQVIHSGVQLLTALGRWLMKERRAEQRDLTAV